MVAVSCAAQTARSAVFGDVPRRGVEALATQSADRNAVVSAIAVGDPARAGLLACGRLGVAQPAAVQPVPDGVRMNAQLVGDLDERPHPLGHTVNQICPEVSEPKLAGALGQTLVSGAAALTGTADFR